MSAATSSPQSINEPSRDISAFKSQIHDDPFLPNPSISDEQLTSSADGYSTTVNLSELENNPNGQLSTKDFHIDSLSVSPTNLQLLGGSTANTTYSRPNTNPPSNVHSPTSHQDFLSPSGYVENEYSDFSSYASPEPDNPFFLEPEFGLHSEFEPSTLPVLDNAQHQIPEVRKPPRLRNEQSLDTTTSTTSQLLSPVLTNTPSPPSDTQKDDSSEVRDVRDMADRLSRLDIPAHRFQQTPTLTTTSPCSDSPAANSLTHGDRPASPNIKVSSYTRGDSPSRTDEPMGQKSGKRGRTTLSSSHLAPTNNDDSYEDDDHYVGSQYRSISVPTPSIRGEDGSWAASTTTRQRGLDPASRGNIYVPSPKEIMEQRKREQKNADVEQWLSVSEANSEIEDNDGPKIRARGRKNLAKPRPRAKSTGDPSASTQQFFDDSGIPGPGILIDEDSGWEGMEGEDESDASENVRDSPVITVDKLNVRDEPSEGGYFPPVNDNDIQDTEPLPRQFIRARPWQDPPRNPRFGDTRHQPSNSNAAIMRYQRAAENIETASRAATWGTRRLSESDIGSVRGSFKTLNANSAEKEKSHSRRNSVLDRASRLIPRRSNSNAKRKADALQQQHSMDPVAKTKQKDPREGGLAGSILPQRKSSFTRSPKSPLKTGNAVAAMTGQIAAVGGGSPVGVSSPSLTSNPWNSFMRRRSKSELSKNHKASGSGGLMELMTNFGGPPVPSLASPLQDKVLVPSPISGKGQNDDDEDDYDDGDEVMGGKGTTMDLSVRTDPIVPTLEGFRTQIQQLNPRLEPVLVERISQEQVRRYKKLVDLKIQHSHAVGMRKCAAGDHCFDQGGKATMLPPRISSKDPDSTHAQFQISPSGAPNDDLSGFGEAAVTAAQFPHGVPLPPVNRLPAKFECPLCFKVKQFQKPSDWTKHVHEDVMPFTCTFPDCSEPKSFKRKADWVRHESERHRKLERWTCNKPDCSHTCFRKDNFVQHLVREHKMPEPKVKASRGRGSRNGKGPVKNVDDRPRSAHEQGVEEVWRLVEMCYHNENKQAQNDPCRFCGNVLNSFKKLSVHMAKHMEQIAMPVLGLVDKRATPNDTNGIPTELGGYPSQQRALNGLSPINQSSLPATESYPNSFQSDQTATTNVDHSSYYGSTPQNSEAYTTVQSPLLAEHLQMQNELTAIPLGMGGRSISAGGPNYHLSPYSQASSPSVRGQNPYPNVTQDSRQFNPHLASATYPPPYNAVSRRHGVTISEANQQAVGAPTYALDVSPGVANSTAYDNQQQMYTSPVENIGYVYQQGQDPMGQVDAVHYGGSSGQPEVYMHPSGGQYPYQNQ
ncbi:hypothetical protein AJ79_05254 [Helicocarpus griseus UAMH5409]|uniref:C2H2-type domain-containing protein n=1 Tax=Helicocarpus griseus UAMH5409 TaxID=1447875 RepID=A0A2B7XPQ5_9EURO|nr:hypothetical protein AJ79_05254 [Helicocarpus griseus UAMH5409]